MKRASLAVLAGFLVGFVSLSARAAETMTLSIKNHRFEPATLTVPAHKKVRLTIKNLDPTPEEFESPALNREKVVGGGKQIVLFIGPLKPGTYKFYGEFHPATAQGRVVAK